MLCLAAVLGLAHDRPSNDTFSQSVLAKVLADPDKAVPTPVLVATIHGRQWLLLAGATRLVAMLT